MEPLEDLAPTEGWFSYGDEGRLEFEAITLGKILHGSHIGALFHDTRHGIISALGHSCNFKSVNNLTNFLGAGSW